MCAFVFKKTYLECAYFVFSSRSFLFDKALQPFFLTKSEKKLMMSYHNNMPAIQEMHRAIWPGEDIKLLRPKHSKSRGSQDLSQDTWFMETTMPTSVYVSLIIFTISCKFRQRSDRAHAAMGFTSLCSTLCGVLNGSSLQHIKIGSGRSVTLTVSDTGTLPGHQFWSSTYFTQHIDKIWREDVDDESKPWVAHSNGLANLIHLSEIICFCLDPQHPKQVQNDLWDATLALVSQIAKYLDDGLPQLLRVSEDINITNSGSKNKRRLASNIKTIWAERVARKVWDGEDSG